MATAPSRINVKDNTLSVYWRDEANADWGYKALRNAGQAELVNHELTMFAPATDRTMPGIHMPNNVQGVDYAKHMRILGMPHEIVQMTQQLIANEHAKHALGNLGITGDGVNHSTAHASSAGIAHERSHGIS